MSAGASSEKGWDYSSGNSFIDQSQLGGLQDLWSRALNLTNAKRAKSNANASVRGTMPGVQAGFNSLVGLADPSSQIAAQEQSLKSGLGSLWRDEINPSISGGAAAAGGYGGGRQGVAQGVAAGQLGNSYTQGLGDITARANAQAGQAAGMLGPMAGVMAQLSNAGQTAGQGVLTNLAGILGNPAILNQFVKQGGQEGSKAEFAVGAK